MHRRRFLLTSAALATPFSMARAAAAPFAAGPLAALEAEITAAISRKEAPGAVLWIEKNGRSWHKAWGNRMVDPEVRPMTEDTIFDAASLTKVCATTPCILRLAGKGMLGLDKPASTWLPEFTGDGKEKITLRQMMTHTSGLRPGVRRDVEWTGPARGLELAFAEPVKGPPGSFTYSDINFILLGEIVSRVSGMPLNKYAETILYRPLGMKDTGYLPSRTKLGRIAPTTREASGLVHGVVHDPTARKLGGVAGHAGLFTTASDLARYCRLLLTRSGSLGKITVCSAATARASVTNQTPGKDYQRGLGWDIQTGYSDPKGAAFGPASFGHTGWTGTSMWVDPEAQMFVILLTNRNHPTESGKVKELRYKVASLAAEAAGLKPRR